MARHTQHPATATAISPGAPSVGDPAPGSSSTDRSGTAIELGDRVFGSALGQKTAFSDARQHDETILRWNRCVRLMQSLPRTEEPKEAVGLYVADGAPVA